MKKLFCLMIAAMLLVSMAAAAGADSGNKLGDFSNRLKKTTQKQETQTTGETEEVAVQAPQTTETVAETAESVSYGAEVRLNDSRFQIARSSVYEYSSSYMYHKYVCMEIKNVSGGTIYPEYATISAYNADGDVIDNSDYNTCYPKEIENGESFFVWKSFSADTAKSFTSFEVAIDAKTSSYREYAELEGEAYVKDGLAYVKVANPTDKSVYDITAIIVVEDDTGKIVHLGFVYGDGFGILPGGDIMIRSRAYNHGDYSDVVDGKATAYIEYMPE